MLFKKKDNHGNPNYFDISNSRLAGGLVIGLLYAFTLYAFFYMSREVFRLMSVSDTFDMWVLTDKEVNFYNLIFAFIAVIFAQSACFTFWLDRPRKIFRKFHYKNAYIVNDQRFLNWSFLSWAVRGATIIGLFFGMTFRGRVLCF